MVNDTAISKTAQQVEMIKQLKEISIQEAKILKCKIMQIIIEPYS